MNNCNLSYWTAFYTKPRSEKKSADKLEANGFEVYCPTRTVLKQWSDRKKKVIEPVFTSYLFAKVDEQSRIEVLKNPGIVSSVRWLGRPVRIRDREIQEIRTFLGEFPSAELVQENFQFGDEIGVSSGPLAGQNGIIRKTQGNRAYIYIFSLGLQIQAEVNLRNLKKRY